MTTTVSPFYDQAFANPRSIPEPAHPYHRRQGACQAAYARGCRCNDCRKAWREGVRRRNGAQPSALTIDNAVLEAELDAAETNLHALREENAMLRTRIQELEGDQ